MATRARKTNFARASIWTETMRINVEGTISAVALEIFGFVADPKMRETLLQLMRERDEQLKKGRCMSVLTEWGMCCPQCGDDEKLTIIGTVNLELDVGGTQVVGDHEWGPECACSCRACDWNGIVLNATEAGTTKLHTKIRETAKAGSDEIDIIEDAPIDIADDGFWVPARIYISKGELS